MKKDNFVLVLTSSTALTSLMNNMMHDMPTTRVGAIYSDRSCPALESFTKREKILHIQDRLGDYSELLSIASRAAVVVVDNLIDPAPVYALQRMLITGTPIVASTPHLDWWYTALDLQHPYEHLTVHNRQGERETPYDERSFQYTIRDLNKEEVLVNMEVMLSKGDNKLSMNCKVDTINKQVFTSVINTLATL